MENPPSGGKRPAEYPEPYKQRSKMNMPPVIDYEKCEKCGLCADVCPVDVYYESKEGEIPTVTYGEDCFFCAACILECPTDAITLRFPLYAQPSYLQDT